MINPYKRSDVFKCSSTGHEKFENRVSVYHVLKVKKCFPQGCIYFKWKCTLLNKGKRCLRGYGYVGRKCFGCKHYYDEKINNQPTLQIAENEYRELLENIDDFEDWCQSVQYKNNDIEGKIISIKPALSKTVENKNSYLKLYGYFIHFNEAFINATHWEDHCYLFLRPELQEKYHFSNKDRIEFRARVELDNGRLVFNKINSINILEKSGNAAWSSSDARVAKHTIITMKSQHSKCLQCRHGVLVDVTDKSKHDWVRRRDLMCLKSVNDPKSCIYHIEDKLNEELEGCLKD